MANQDNEKNQKSKDNSRRSAWRTTTFFALGMAAILVLAIVASQYRPPLMPRDSDHMTREAFPNATCAKVDCHPPEKLTESHPRDRQKIPCIKCHQLGDTAYKPRDRASPPPQSGERPADLPPSG